MTDHTATDHTASDPTRIPWRSVPLSRIPRGTEVRSADGQVGGVIAGLCRAYGFDLRSTRIAVVVATLVLPVLFVAYVAAWVLLPEAPQPAQSISDITHDRRRLPVLVAIVLVLVAGSLGSFGSWFLFEGAPWGMVLIAVGILLWASTTMSRRGRPATPSSEASLSTATTTLTTPPVAPFVRRRRRPIAIGSIVLAAAFVAVAALLDAAGAWNPLIVWVVVVALGIVTAGFAASAVINRNWWLVLPVLALVPAVSLLSITRPHLEGGAGDRTVQPITIAQAERFQQLGAGQLVLDLTRLAEGSTDVHVSARVGVGYLHVIVPNDVTLQLSTEVGGGTLHVNGDELFDGFRESDVRTLPALTGTSARVVTLDLEIGMGAIAVDQTPALVRPSLVP